MRAWGSVDAAARSGKLASRLTTRSEVQWSAFDALKSCALEWFSGFERQVATQVDENTMMLQLLRLVHALVQSGFYTSGQISSFVPTLVRVLDGRLDRVGLQREGERADLRYGRHKTSMCDTVVIMESKVWACKVLELVCVMRLDIRLSHVLALYREEWEQDRWRPGGPTKEATSPSSLVLLKESSLEVVKNTNSHPPRTPLHTAPLHSTQRHFIQRHSTSCASSPHAPLHPVQRLSHLLYTMQVRALTRMVTVSSKVSKRLSLGAVQGYQELTDEGVASRCSLSSR